MPVTHPTTILAILLPPFVAGCPLLCFGLTKKLLVVHTTTIFAGPCLEMIASCSFFILHATLIALGWAD
uniref:Uncharacterized protein n=1 Tax=Anopheles darlingi TaxID=43151 RepID=A0A2M4DCU1_ANODA